MDRALCPSELDRITYYSVSEAQGLSSIHTFLHSLVVVTVVHVSIFWVQKVYHI